MTTAAAAFTYIGMTADGSMHVFASTMSWDVAVFGVYSKEWLSNADPDFPRFMLDGDFLHDLDTNHTYTVISAGI